jgi:hypothetical protein
MYIFFLLISLASAEAPSLRTLKETTFTRDNTYCKIGTKKFEIQIRSEASQTEKKIKNYGEYIFYYLTELPQLLPLNADKLNNYRLFKGTNTLCSKSYGHAIGEDKIAVLFLKENSPFMDKLSFQLINTKTLEPENIIETEYVSDKTDFSPGGFVFRTYENRNGLVMGNIKIDEIAYTFHNRDFPYWIKYSTNGFEISPTTSFENFEWKKHFKNEKDFFDATGWDDKEKKFKKQVLNLAVNHELKKECILLSSEKINLTGSEEGWRCN